MNLSYLKDEDYVNYKLPHMFLGTTKCNKNCQDCHNQHLREVTPRNIEDVFLVVRYTRNPLTKAIVLGGLDPFDTFKEVYEFYRVLRRRVKDTVVIYTGYDYEDIKEEVEQLIKSGGHLIIKYGAYQPGDKPHLDPILGVELASDNQYAEEYNYEDKKN